MPPTKKSPSNSKKTAAAAPKSVEAIRHRDKRANIPTQELRDFVREEEAAPGSVLYPRDTSLDPQLVWKGKDEQDRNPLEVPLVPVYIQEKIHPQALIENLRDTAAAGEPEPEQMLFSDFNGIEFEDLIEFYQHEQNWANRMILGDSQLVMASLAEKEGLKGKVQMIYLDPPYGIKFKSNWQVSTRDRDVKDTRSADLTRQPEQIRAFRDTWKLGIHSYLGYLRDRLILARDLLAASGSIFLQIGDLNVHLARCLLDEIFGIENFVSLIPFKKTSAMGSARLDTVNDYIILYAKNLETLKYRQLYFSKSDPDTYAFTYVEAKNGSVRRLTSAEKKEFDDSLGALLRTDNLTSQSGGESTGFSYSINNANFRPSGNSFWKTNRAGMDKLNAAGRLMPVGNTLTYKRYQSDFPARAITSWWDDTVQSTFATENFYVVQTYSKVIERCLLMTTDPGDLVLDPTCGSGTTAYVAEQWGRRWITIDTSRVALALARTRLMCAKYPYYLLADSQEGVQKEAEVTGKVPPGYRTEGDIRKGFVYKRVPHVTLKSIANNPEIREGMSREEIDRAIAKYADTEVLYDQPYEDGKRIRVTGPFTVESLSPHRVLSDDASAPRSEREGQDALTSGKFETMILDNLKKAGVQNTKKGERLVFDRLEPFAGEWLQGAGEYTEAGGKVRRVAVCIGPEHGTVGPELVKEAAKEALKGVGFDLVVVCGFAFDSHAGETAKEFSPQDAGETPAPQFAGETPAPQFAGEAPAPQLGSNADGTSAPQRGKKSKSDGFVAEDARQYGKLPILLARMNPDLAMGDELLKKTGAGNLFMVFGEPDISVVGGEWLVTRHGRMVAYYGVVKELSGLGSLEEINRLGGADLSRLKRLSEGREVWADEPGSTGGSFGSGKRGGGSGPDGDKGVSSVSKRGERVAGRGGDLSHSDGAAGVADGSGAFAVGSASRGNQPHAGRTQAVAAIQDLTSGDFPLALTTSHYTQVTLQGLDVYDPTTGQLRSNSTDDIACWFIDTDYNGESFFVRHAYFTGAGDPYDKLKRALRAEIDEGAWASLYTTTSRPFEKPRSGRIAVKVINHYGDEVLKVYEVA